MILSNEKVRELLKIFENPKSVSPYDNLREKEEMKNASTFINNYHIYGPPKKQNLDNINRNPSLNSKNNSILKNSTFGNKNIDPYELEIKRSINNLKIGREQYLKQEESKSLNRRFYESYNPYSTSTYSSQLYKNQTIFNNILNSKTLASTQYPYKQYENNTYNSNSTYNFKKSYNPKYSTYSKLKEIPSNPEDVEIKELPPNYTISVNPILNSNVPMGIPVGMNSNMSQNEPPMISQNLNLNEPPKLVEEINTDIIDNEDNQKNEEPEIEENQNLQNEEVAETVEEPQTSGKYQITEFNGPVKLPAGYSTNDEDEFNAIQFLNTDLSTWKKQIDKNNIIVYSKLYKVKNDKGKLDDNIMFYAEATLNFPASLVNRQLNTYELREKWEESLKKGKLLKEEDLGNGCKITEYYSYIKMPFIIADRDMVIRKKRWEDYQGEKDCCLIQIHSIEHPAYPPKEKPVRAEFENRGEFIKPIDNSKCKLYICSKFNMKLSVAASMMEVKGSEGQEKWVKEFIKQCGK